MARQYKIGELARLYRLNPDTLRYYEEQGLLHPRRAANGYRVYSPQDAWRLNVIRDLRGLGLPLETIRSYLEDHSAGSTLRLMDAELALLRGQQRQLERMVQNIRQRRQALSAALRQPVGQVFERRLGERRAHLIPQGYRTDEEMDLLIQQLMEFDRERLYLVGNDEIGSVLNLPAAQEGLCRQYEGVFAIHPNGAQTFAGGVYLCLCYRGSCSQNYQYLPQLFEAARQGGWYPAGPLLELMRTDIHISSDPAEHLTELQLKVVPNALASLAPGPGQ